MNILTIDPAGTGGDSGVTLGYYDSDTAYTLTYSKHVDNLVHGMVEWLLNHVTVADDGVFFHFEDGHAVHIDTVIVENFQDFGIRGADWSPLKVIGAIEGFFHGYNIILRNPSQRTFVTNDVLHNLGAYVAGGHHRDVTESARHAVAWLADNKHKPTIDKGWPHAERF